MKGNRGLCVRGNLTVEAAMIMPIIIFTLFSLIYLAFYLHDMCRIQGMMNKTLQKAGITVKHTADIATGNIYYEGIDERGVFYQAFGNTKEDETKIKLYLQQELSKGLFLSKVTEVDSEVGKLNITISVEAETKVSLPVIKQLFVSLSQKVIVGEYPIHNPTETIRRCEVILDTGSKIKGVEELKEKLEDVFSRD